MRWGCGKSEPLYTVDRDIIWCRHCGKQYRGSSKKLKIESPCDPGIPFLGIHVYLKKMKALIWKDTSTPMFTAALITIVSLWKQLKHPSTDEWIKMMSRTWLSDWTATANTMECYTAIKKNETLTLLATYRDPETIILSAISQREKNKYWILSLTCAILKIKQRYITK